MTRQIIHVDMDAFYASVEQHDQPELQGKPVIVGGSAEARGVVSAASYEARKFGAHSAMPMSTAVRLCPQAIVMPVRMDHYVEVSQQVRHILDGYTAKVEPISIDEAFLDVTDCVRFLGPAPKIAKSIKTAIKDKTGLTASIGVAPNKFLAKLASDLEKPDGLVIISDGNKQDVLDPLPVSRIWGVGNVTAETLKARGIGTIVDLRSQPLSTLRDLVGNGAAQLLELAHGIDGRPVQTESQAKNLSSERTFATDIEDHDTLRGVLHEQVQEVAERLRSHGLRARTITIKLRYADFRTVTRSQSLPEASDVTDTLWRAAGAVFQKWYGASRGPLRLIGFGVSGLTGQSEQQQELFADRQQEKQRRVDRAVDVIRDRFGPNALRRGPSG